MYRDDSDEHKDIEVWIDGTQRSDCIERHIVVWVPDARAQAATGARADSGAGRRAQVFILPQPNQRSTTIQALTLGLCRSG